MPNSPLIKLPTLEFNIRSFHPEKDFGWSGMLFEGDNRSFSNRPNNEVTSRIWHRFILDLPTSVNGELLREMTHSDPSKAPWADKKREYGGKLKPSGFIKPLAKKESVNGIQHYRIEGRYGGVNHAMPLSPTMQETIGYSYVPTLDVSYELRIDVDTINKHIDIVTYIKGDGFPNCEAFVRNKKGQSIFLGTHVRKGAAPISLALNLDYPMIAGAIRLPFNDSGSFTGTLGDEWSRQKNKKSQLEFDSLEIWNRKFLNSNPNHRHCMLIEKASLEGCFVSI
ncbi:MAG: hypothetical protein COB04_18300 [Gammaproteobacteria bacterium]|nr:MAG: hypothetical protein COB04_18300 [Gammaproteobacteria bacterium]